jgi:hypothetical protein
LRCSPIAGFEQGRRRANGFTSRACAKQFIYNGLVFSQIGLSVAFAPDFRRFDHSSSPRQFCAKTLLPLF